jgi:agmatinase
MAVPAFDPNAAATGDGIFGLPHGRGEAAVVLVPVPFDATTSYRPGAVDGPDAILAASAQVDLFDAQTGRPYEAGIHMLRDDGELAALSRATRVRVARALATSDPADFAAVDEAGRRVNERVAREVHAIARSGQIPGVVGGDHAVAFGGIAALASELSAALGILHVDAHCDLRAAYQGFQWSHASVMHNVLAEVDAVTALVQVGLRDVCDAELGAVAASAGRVTAHFDLDWQRRLLDGERFSRLCNEALAPLPRDVWVSFDVDGLDPALCPHTGTPVPGGLSFAQACLLLEAVHRSGRRIAGFDLCEVAPGPAAGDGVDSYDAIVGARLLYKLCGFSILTRASQ